MSAEIPASVDSHGVETDSTWSTYFPNEEFSTSDRRVNLIAQIMDFLNSQGGYLLSQIQTQDGISFLPVDFKELQKSCTIKDLFLALEIVPKEALMCMAAAVHEVLLCTKMPVGYYEKINVRLYNHPDSMVTLKNLKAAYIGRLVSVKGVVVKMSVVKPLVVQMNFTCTKCHSVISCQFPDGKYSPPSSCIIPNCRSKSFTPIRCSAHTLDFQKIRIQELLQAQNHEEGRIPRTVECELTEDLVDSCIPGDAVTVCGTVKAINTDVDVGGGKTKSKNQGLFYLYLEAVSVTNLKSQATNECLQGEKVSSMRVAMTSNLHQFTSRDLEFIVKFTEEHGEDAFRYILHSLCPSIYGHELVKAGITLALFGGVQKNLNNENKVPVRGDIHVLIVGDPGLGKSQLLQAAASVASRGIYVCGNTTTNAGLTVAVVKDSMTGDYAFEAGAMVLADRGVCCIDEFDKMSAEHQALLEAMEQQCVSIAKAGLVASLSARTSVLAAANPVGGHYNRAKTVNENLKMSAALLSRFDLVFILLDKPDELLDKRVSEHIMSLHMGSEDRPSSSNDPLLEVTQGRVGNTERNKSLATRLKLNPVKDHDFDPLPGPLLRKYIAYAKQYVFPRMSSSAAEVLKEFYLKLRSHSMEADGTPITARQLESLVRLVEARARLELREEITKQDALDVVEIMKESLYDKYIDEHGYVDFTRSGGMSQQKESKRFLSALQQRSELQQNACFSVAELYALADEISLHVPDLDAVIDNLNSAGYLLKKGHRVYQVLTSSYSGTQHGSQSRRRRH